MKHHLNSVLIEGTVVQTVEPTQLDDTKTVTECVIPIQSVAVFKDQNELTDVAVVVRDKLAQNCADYLTEGREIRVVGRMRADDTGIYVLAEHVEFMMSRTRQTA